MPFCLKTVESYGGAILTIVETIKYSYINEFARAIIRDPLVRTKIFGTKYDNRLEKNHSSKGVEGKVIRNDAIVECSSEIRKLKDGE